MQSSRLRLILRDVGDEVGNFPQRSKNSPLCGGREGRRALVATTRSAARQTVDADPKMTECSCSFGPTLTAAQLFFKPLWEDDLNKIVRDLVSMNAGAWGRTSLILRRIMRIEPFHRPPV